MAEIKMSNQLTQDTGVKMLVYAEAGVGKTMLAMTLPRPLIISAEKGLLSITPENVDRVFGPMGLPYVNAAPVIEVSSIQDINDAYAVCTHPEYQGNFDSIVIDSISEIAEKLLAEIKPTYKDPRKAYIDMFDQMLEVIRRFRDVSGKHVYMTAKIGKNKDEMSGQTYLGPSTPGTKLSEQLPFMFDEVFRYCIMQTEQGIVRMLQTQPGLSDSAKDRSGKLAQYEPGHLGYIINKIKGIA